MFKTVKSAVLVCALTGINAPVLAQQLDDLDALALADKAQQKAEKASDIHWFAEAAAGLSSLRGTETSSLVQRLSFDLHIDKVFAPGWRAVFADRLDLNRQRQPDQPNPQIVRHNVNTLREAYLSWQLNDHQLIDLGRINAATGVASGYNPTDFFRADSVRSLVSVDPGSLKKNRLGSVMLRAQHLWSNGSVIAQYSPKLEMKATSASSASDFSPDFGATNHQGRYLIAVSQQLADGITPQWLIYGQERQAPQLGCNLTTLINDATVAYFEWSGGRSSSLASQATKATQTAQTAQGLNSGEHRQFRNHLASGVTYTTTNKLSLSLEYEYSGTGMDAASWTLFRQGSGTASAIAPGAAYSRYRAFQQSTQELATKEELFFYANWQDAIVNNLDLSGMRKIDLADHSKLTWLEARYRMNKADVALQWQRNSGDATSVYGASLQKMAWQASFRYYF
ncbi:hypothetical protein [Undibacterium sp. Di24W]|uniref:hypothetical protein n=1 Tax=Undibacterium sp. Di24W TaxID=3413033 RepID=UPI003BF0ECC2